MASEKSWLLTGTAGTLPLWLGWQVNLEKERRYLYRFLFGGKQLENVCQRFSAKENLDTRQQETSVNLALHPRLVNMNKAVDEKPSRPFFDASSFSVNYRLDTAAYTSPGGFGTSTTASVKKGKKIFEVAVEELVKHIKAVKKSKIDDLLPEPLV